MNVLHEKIRQAAHEAFPAEACGVVLRGENGGIVIPCRNQALSPRDTFQLHPEDYAAAEALGEIVGIFHSHPNSPAVPSPADRAACNRSALPWLIYSVPADAFAEIRPESAEPPLLGREFVWGVFDCGTLVADYYRQTLGIHLAVEPYPEEFWTAPGHKPYLQKFLENGFHLVPKEELRVHDCLLMQVTAPDEPDHAGIYVGGGEFLHHLQRHLSRPDVYGSYWQRRTIYVLRHPEVPCAP